MESQHSRKFQILLKFFFVEKFSKFFFEILKRQYVHMACADKPACVVGNRLVTLNELLVLIIDLYPKKINHFIRWEDHSGMEP